jgi:hypothetical protein
MTWHRHASSQNILALCHAETCPTNSRLAMVQTVIMHADSWVLQQEKLISHVNLRVNG